MMVSPVDFSIILRDLIISYCIGGTIENMTVLYTCPVESLYLVLSQRQLVEKLIVIIWVSTMK